MAEAQAQLSTLRPGQRPPATRANRLTTVGAALVMAVALVACTGSDDAGTPSTGGSDGDATVRLENIEFAPAQVEIVAGETVTWVWEDGNVPHDVAFDDGPASPRQRSGAWDRTFDEPGTYDYVCTLHPTMTGVIAVS